MKAMVLAAGRGERMGELTAGTAKPLLRPGAEALIDRQIRGLRAAGIVELVVNLSWCAEQIRRHLGDGGRFGVTIEYSDEGEPPLETAGGIVQALPKLGPDPFLVVNADLLTDFDFAVLRAHAAIRDGTLGTLVMVPNPAHHRAGDYGIDAAGLAQLDPPRLTYAGICVLHPQLFAGVTPGRGTLRPLFDAAIAARQLAAIRHDGLWIDVGTPQRFAEARRALAAVSD